MAAYPSDLGDLVQAWRQEQVDLEPQLQYLVLDRQGRWEVMRGVAASNARKEGLDVFLLPTPPTDET